MVRNQYKKNCDKGQSAREYYHKEIIFLLNKELPISGVIQQ